MVWKLPSFLTSEIWIWRRKKNFFLTSTIRPLFSVHGRLVTGYRLLAFLVVVKCALLSALPLPETSRVEMVPVQWLPVFSEFCSLGFPWLRLLALMLSGFHWALFVAAQRTLIQSTLGQVAVVRDPNGLGWGLALSSQCPKQQDLSLTHTSSSPSPGNAGRAGALLGVSKQQDIWSPMELELQVCFGRRGSQGSSQADWVPV